MSDTNVSDAALQRRGARSVSRAYIQRAKALADRNAASKAYPITSPCQKIGQHWGVGVGLYFKTLQWLAGVFFILALTAVPFFIVINTSVFTDEKHKNNYSFGITVFERIQLLSFSFAAIPDTALDNNTLQWMNTKLAGTWMGPMSKATFLTWLSLVDAGAVVLLLCAITYMTLQARRFVQSVDARTLEVSSYSVLVRGLPGDATPAEVGEHFSRFGEVMDVVLVRDMAPVLHACEEASKLEQQRNLLTDQMRAEDNALYARRAEVVESRLEDMMRRMEALVDGPQDFPVKAAFVTFNLEVECRACMDNLPHGYWSSRLQPRVDRLRGRNRIWVDKAYAPDDYIQENLACPWYARLARRVVTGVVVIAVLAATAAAITRLGSINVSANQDTVWRTGAMQTDIAAAAGMLQASANTQAAQMPVAIPSLATVTSTLKQLYTQAVASAGGQAANWQAYCSVALPTACAPLYGGLVNASSTGFNMTYGQLLQWSDQAQMLMKQRPLLQALESCAQGDTSSQPSFCQTLASTLAPAACLPCMCLGVSSQPDAPDTNSVQWASDARAQCQTYVEAWDVKSLGIRILVAAVIAAVNWVLKVILELLMSVEVHNTRSERECEYAVLAFVSQILNSMLVLLLVNAAPVRDVTNTSTVSWVHYLVLDGSYNDFTPAWYRDVGFTIIVVMILQVLNPLTTLLADWGYKLAVRLYTVRCDKKAAQADYNKAFARPEFSLAQRVADAMVSTCVALMFGSGIPLLYVIALGVFVTTIIAERVALMRLCTVTSRYHKRLPELMIGVLPWAALIHCLFGLWMHTYFPVISPNDISPNSNSNTNSSTGTGTGTGATLATVTAQTAVGQAINTQTILDRITAPNGIALLVCAGVIALWLLFKYVLWPLLRPVLAQRVHRWCCACCVPLLLGPDPGLVPYEVALLSGRLRGTATYRLHHHPGYAHVFDGALHKAIWLRACGPMRYTRLVSGRGGLCNLVVSHEVVRSVAPSELETALAAGQLPNHLASLASRLATPLQSAHGSSSGGGAKWWRPGSFKQRSIANLNSHNGNNNPTVNDNNNPSSPSRTVHIQVIADTPYGSVQPSAAAAAVAQGVPRHSPHSHPSTNSPRTHTHTAPAIGIPVALIAPPDRHAAMPSRAPYEMPMPTDELLAMAAPQLARVANTRGPNGSPHRATGDSSVHSRASSGHSTPRSAAEVAAAAATPPVSSRLRPYARPAGAAAPAAAPTLPYPYGISTVPIGRVDGSPQNQSHHHQGNGYGYRPVQGGLNPRLYSPATGMLHTLQHGVNSGSPVSVERLPHQLRSASASPSQAPAMHPLMSVPVHDPSVMARAQMATRIRSVGSEALLQAVTQRPSPRNSVTSLPLGSQR